MSALGEQLLHDYLSRLFAAGRGRLTRAERRALVMRTASFIQQSTGPVGGASELDVAKFLAELGDPAGIVVAEEARLSAAHGETLPERADRVRGLGRAPRRLPGQTRLNWPAQPARSPELTRSLMAAAAESERPASQDERVLTGKIIRPDTPLHGSDPEPDAGLPPDEVGPEEFAAADDVGAEPAATIIEPGRRPSWPSVVATDASWLDTVLDRGTLRAEARDEAALDGGVDEELPDDGALDQEESEPPLGGEALVAWAAIVRWSDLARRRAKLSAAWVADSFRRHPVESAAAVLLGIGGAAFPPVWLLGAAVALASRLWDGRDKWIGLAVPLMATILGTVVGVCLTGGASLGHDVHDGWMFADVLSRIAAVLGAGYLIWRGARGRRPAAVPPWARPHKVG